MIAIIPARGGSKRLPGKNLKLLNGIPLINYTISAALNSKFITQVIVSTDCENIAETAKKAGAEVPFLRPESLATDTATSEDVIKHAISFIENKNNILIDDLVVLQATSPLRTSNNIDEAIALFYNKKADSVISFCKEYHPIIWHKHLSEEGLIKNLDSQVLKQLENKTSYFPNGAIYVYKKNIIGQDFFQIKNSYAYLMDRNQSIDIDTIDDFNFAEWIIKSKL